MAKEKSDVDEIRLTIKVNKYAHPELFEELIKTPKSYQTERFRLLAMLSLSGSGLNVQQRVAPELSPTPSATTLAGESKSTDEESVENTVDNALEEKRKKMKGRINF